MIVNSIYYQEEDNSNLELLEEYRVEDGEAEYLTYRSYIGRCFWLGKGNDHRKVVLPFSL